MMQADTAHFTQKGPVLDGKWVSDPLLGSKSGYLAFGVSLTLVWKKKYKLTLILALNALYYLISRVLSSFHLFFAYLTWTMIFFFPFLAESISNASSEKCVSHVYNGYVNGEDQLTHGYSLRDTENDAKTRRLVWAPSDDILAHKSWETCPFILSKTQNYLCANQPAEESSVWRKPV